MEEGVLKEILNVVVDIKADQKVMKETIDRMEKEQKVMQIQISNMQLEQKTTNDKLNKVILEQIDTKDIVISLVDKVGEINHKVDVLTNGQVYA